MQTRTARLPLLNRLDFRIGLIVFVAFFAAELLLTPFWEWIIREFTDWGDPNFIRAYADYLEGRPTTDPSRFEFKYLASPVMLFATIGYVTLYALIFATFVSILATRRLKSLTRQVAESPDPQTGLPDQFQVRGNDEIGYLATKMNAMRDRIKGLLAQTRERDRLRTEWVSHVSHDLRTPLMALTAVVGRCRSALELPPEEMTQELPALLDAAELDTQRIRDLAEDLLEMARLEVNADLQLEPVPPGELLRWVTQELAPVAESRAIQLQVSCPVQTLDLRADGRRLIRAVENITLNSLQHAATTVQLSVRQRDRWLDIVIDDDGPGLPEQRGAIHLTQIGRDASRPDSAGIGLEVAQRIITAHRGKITAQNQTSGGARLVISLPLGEAAPESQT